MALNSCRPQLFGRKGVRDVLKHMPNVGHAISAPLEKHWQATTHPKFYPCAKMPLISAFRRGRNCVSHEFEANNEVHRDMPAAPRSCSCHIISGRIARRLTRTEARSQHEIPSALTLKTPRTCFVSKCQPEDNSKTPRRRLNLPHLGSFPLRIRRIHSTAASFSPRNNTLSPNAAGRSADGDTRANAETTIPSSSRTLIDISFSPATDLLDPQKRDCPPASRSYLLYTPDSRQKPPTAVLDASENRVRWEGRSSK